MDVVFFGRDIMRCTNSVICNCYYVCVYRESVDYLDHLDFKGK